MQKIISDEAGLELTGMAVSRGIISDVDFNKVITLNKESGKSVVSILFEQKLMDEYSLAKLVADNYGLKFEEIDENNLNLEAQKKVGDLYIQSNCIFPIDFENDVIKIAICDQTKLNLEKNLKLITGLNVELVLVTIKNLEQLFVKAGIDIISTKDLAVMGSFRRKEEDETAAREQVITETEKTEAQNFVTDILTQAYKKNVSDIHIESFRNKKRIRFRIDGILIVQKDFDKKINEKYRAVVAILKLLSGAKIEERRLPQDGAIQFSSGKIEFDLRVSFLPVQGSSERVVMRLLRKDAISYELNKLGFPKSDFSNLENAIMATQGLILVTGPTGSGKTTTLYSILRHLNDEKRNILTAEDPIEYELEGISQSQMKSDINFTFARALRTFLRQDPEVILVGEIRDTETGNVAVESALTGHLVLSTLHTNDAVNTVTRLIDMGIPNYLVSATLSLVVAQRLPRKICSKCKTEDKDTTKEQLKTINFDPKDKVFVGKGCNACNKTGYSGRNGVYEILKITANIQDAILAKKSAPQIYDVAKAEGFKTMHEHGIRMMKEGILSFEEYQRTLFTS